MSTLKVSTISPVGTDATKTITLGASGDTLSIPSGCTISNSGTASGFGKIGQVIQTSLTDNNQTLNTTTFTDLTNLTVSITPTSTSSKILITSAIQVALDDSAGARAYMRLLRGTDVIQTLAGITDNNVSSQGENYVFNFLDSPNSTSSQTYKVQAKSTNSSLDIRFVYNTNDSISTVTTLTAMEVLA